MTITDILTITPSNMINREIRRWIKGFISTTELDYLIMVEVWENRFHPNTDPDTIRRVAVESYSL